MNVVRSNMIIAAIPMAAALVAGLWARESRRGAWWMFAVVCLVWTVIVVPTPQGNPIGTREEWLRRLRGVAALPAAIACGAAVVAVMARRGRRAADNHPLQRTGDAVE